MSVSTRAWLFGAGFFLVVLLISAPARLLGYFLPAETLSLQGFEGSLWRGSAASGQVAAGPGKLQLGRVEWDVSVHSLLLLTPRIRFTSQWGGQSVRADVSVSPTGVLRLRDTRVVAPAAMIRHWLPVQLGGEVDLVLDDLRLAGATPREGAGFLTWKNAYWIGNNSSQLLGGYRLDFEIDEQGMLQGVVKTLSGAVSAEGAVALNGRQYSVDLQLRARRGFGEEISNALQLMAAPVDGGYHLKFSSEI